MMYTDPGLKPYLPDAKTWEYATAAAGALLVLVLGKFVFGRAKEAPEPT